MTSNPFLLCCLNYEFYSKYKKYLIKDIFPKELVPLFETIQYAFGKNKANLSVDELRGLHLAKNPTMTQANIANMDILLTTLKELPAYNEAIAEDILKETYLQHKAKQLADCAIDIQDNKAHDFQKIRSLTQDLNDFAIRSENTFVPTNVLDLIERSKNNHKWSWCFEPLQERLGNIGPGIFGIIAARPDAGKTAFWINFAFNLDGWLQQGAKVHVFANEEMADNQMKRGISCHLGADWETVAQFPDRANVVMEPVAGNIFIQDAVGWSMEDLHRYCKETPVDILILDQLDKFGITGEFSRTDERLSALYVQARELAKRYNCVVLGITQASNDAHDQLYYGFECLAGSKTGKAAEADFVITIGMKAIESTQGTDNGIRMINLTKNKLTGNKNPVSYVLDHKLSRIKP